MIRCLVEALWFIFTECADDTSVIAESQRSRRGAGGGASLRATTKICAAGLTVDRS